MTDCFAASIQAQVAAVERIWLFLDYDGTLAEFAPTPDDIFPDPELIELLRRLARQPRLRVAVISGRRLAHIQRLVPVPGILLAGSYGIEMQLPDGSLADRLELSEVRPVLETIRQRWSSHLDGHDGFYLEDKRWALAIHAKDADPALAAHLLPAARHSAEQLLAAAPPDRFRILGGDRFLEVGPALAHKGKTVEYLLQQHPWPGALPVFLGDDDKDEEAFRAIRSAGGIALVVGAADRPTAAICRLESPQMARRWLVQALL